VKTANWLPLLVFLGALVTRFTRSSPRGEERVTSLRRSAWEAMFVLLWFGIFLELGFHSDCVQPKRECSPM